MVHRDHVMRSLVWLVGSRGGMQTISFLSTLLVLRVLRPEDYGVIALAGVWTTTLTYAVQLGLGSAIVQYREVVDAELSLCFWLTTGLAVAAYAALYASAPAIGTWFGSPALGPVLRVTGVAIVLSTARLVPESLLRKRLRLDRVSQAEMAGSAATLPTVLGLAWSGAGVWALAAGIVVMHAVQTVLTVAFARWWPNGRVGGTGARPLLRYGIATLGAGSCWLVYVQADTFLLGTLASEGTVGLYAMARQLTTVVAEKISVLVNQIAAPVMAALQDDRAALARSLRRGLRCVAWLTFPMAAGIALAGDLLVGVVLTEKWLPALPILRLLCVYAAIESLAILLPPVLAARYRVGALLRYHVVLVAVLPIAFLVGARAAGAVGTALAWVVVYPLFVLWLAGQVLRELGADWPLVTGELAPPLAATLMMAVTALAVRWAVEGALAGSVVVLAATVLAGVIGHLAGVMVFGRGVRADLTEALRWFGRQRVAIAGGRP